MAPADDGQRDAAEGQARQPRLDARTLWLALGPAAAICLLLVADLEPGRPEVTRMAAMAIWMAIWWMSECVPLAATALLPVALFPFLGIMSAKDVAPVYMDRILFLFIGGFLVAIAMEKWQLHRRVALRTILTVGLTPDRLLLGVMLATWALSMWISNTATCMMMLPIVMAVMTKVDERLEPERSGRVATALLLGIAYAASIGGVATLIGTPTNLSFVRILHATYPDAPDITFARWLLFALPVATWMIFAAWFVLRRLWRLGELRLEVGREALAAELRALGPLGREERAVVIVAGLLGFLWIFREPIALGVVTIPGWSQLPFLPGAMLHDSTVAILCALLLFIIPSGRPDRQPLLVWADAGRLPWDVVLLIGGGFALANGFTETGLSTWCGERLGALGALSPLVMLTVICGLMTFLTELTSNTATCEMVQPILAALSAVLRVNPLLLMVPATLSASFAFMLPVATPPNAIVFGTGRLQVRQMARAGLWLNLLGILIVVLASETWGRRVFGIDLFLRPPWAG